MSPEFPEFTDGDESGATLTIRLTVEDDDGLRGVDTCTVTVQNVGLSDDSDCFIRSVF